jgi:hypothetical protein
LNIRRCNVFQTLKLFKGVADSGLFRRAICMSGGSFAPLQTSNQAVTGLGIPALEVLEDNLIDGAEISCCVKKIPKLKKSGSIRVRGCAGDRVTPLVLDWRYP